MLLALAATWLLLCLIQADTESKPVKMVIIVPERATLYIDDKATKATGTRRTFESPPVAVGAKTNYYYQVRAVWTGPDGKEVVRKEKFYVKPGQVNELDLTKKETPKEIAKLSLDVPGIVDIDVGGKKPIAVKIKREHFKGPVKIAFSGVPKGVTIGDITIPGDKSEGSAALEVAKDSKGGAVDVTVKAEGSEAKTEAKIKLSIKAAPAPVAKLSVEGPGTVNIEPGAKKSVTIKVKRDNFKGPVKVAFAGQPEAIKIPELTIPEDKTEGAVDAVAPKGAKPGTSTVKVLASSDKLKAETEFKLTVKGTAASPAKGSVSLSAPPTVSVEAGGKKAFEIKVKRDNAKGAVKVTFTGVPSGVTIAGATIAADAGATSVEVSAAKDAKPGTTEVTAKTDGAETKFKLEVKAGPKKDK